MKNYITFLLMFALLIGCGPQIPQNSLSFENIEYIKSFPESYELDGGQQVKFEKPGLLGIRIYDSLMFLTFNDCSGYVSVMSLKTGQLSDAFFKNGNGPCELLFPPSLPKTSILKENGVNSMFINTLRGNALKWKIDNIFTDVKQDIDVIDLSSLGTVFDFTCIGSNAYICRELADNERSQVRYIMQDGKRSVIPAMEKLNKAVLPGDSQGYWFNLMSSSVSYSPVKNVMIEASVLLNTINMYSLDGKFEKTICFGKNVDDIDAIYNNGFESLVETFSRIVTTDNYWAVLYLGTPMSYEHVVTFPMPKIFFFDWDGNPLAQIHLTGMVTNFDIDLVNQNLYTLEGSSETLMKYDISHIIESLERTISK